MRVRLKPGVRPIVVDCAMVPEYPTYWTVPESHADAVALLVEDGQAEYERAAAVRGPDGTFAVQPTLAPVAAASAGGARPFSRKR
jgi:hypothetical protein